MSNKNNRLKRAHQQKQKPVVVEETDTFLEQETPVEVKQEQEVILEPVAEVEVSDKVGVVDEESGDVTEGTVVETEAGIAVVSEEGEVLASEVEEVIYQSAYTAELIRYHEQMGTHISPNPALVPNIQSSMIGVLKNLMTKNALERVADFKEAVQFAREHKETFKEVAMLRGVHAALGGYPSAEREALCLINVFSRIAQKGTQVKIPYQQTAIMIGDEAAANLRTLLQQSFNIKMA
jgi:hypothetical protein